MPLIDFWVKTCDSRPAELPLLSSSSMNFLWGVSREPALLFPGSSLGPPLTETMTTPWTAPLVPGPNASANRWPSHLPMRSWGCAVGFHDSTWRSSPCTFLWTKLSDCTALPLLGLSAEAGGQKEEEKGEGAAEENTWRLCRQTQLGQQQWSI